MSDQPTQPERPTFEEWKAIYKSLTEKQQQKLDRLVRKFTQENQRFRTD